MSTVGEQSLINKLKPSKSVGFEKSNETIPRTEFSLTNLVEEYRNQLDAATIHQKIAQELSRPQEEIFSDIPSFGKLLLHKAAQLEQVATVVQFSTNKIHSKMLFTNQCLSGTQEQLNENTQNEMLIMFHQMGIILDQLQDLKVQSEKICTLRDDFHGRMGFPEDSKRTSRIGHPSSIVSHGRASSTSLVENHRASVAPQPAPLKLFAKLPKQIVESGLEKPELMRLSAVYELIETEADYVKDLNTMITFHKVQLKESKLFPDSEIQLIFSNVEELVAANDGFVQKLFARRDENVFIATVGDLLADAAESLNVYSTYAANYPAAMKLVHSYQNKPEQKDALQKWMNAPEARGLSLESFLIKPVQRICKYPLLIRELERYCEKAGNQQDQALLRQAAEKIEAVVTRVNEATRAAEERQRILNLGSMIEADTPLDLHDKVYLKDGMMTRIVNGKPKDRYVILYTDLIIICRPIVPQSGTMRGPPRYELESGYALAELVLQKDMKETVRNVKSAYILGFKIISEDTEPLILGTNTADDLNKWLDIFNTAFKDITEEHRSAVRSNIEKQKGIERQSSGPDMLLSFGRNTLGKGKNAVKSGLSSVAMRKAASRKSQLDMVLDNSAGPEQFRYQGVLHKRAVAATGNIYYYNIETKQTMWTLPDDIQLFDQERVVSSEPPPAMSGSVSQTEITEIEGEEEMTVYMVEGFPEWRKVDRGDGMPYFFHMLTQETRWDPPTAP